MPVYSTTKAGLHAFSMVLRQQLLKTGIKVFEVIPPAVDTELNQAGQAKRNMSSFGVSSSEFVTAVMKGLQNDNFEIGYGMSEGFIKATRAELDQRFQAMNSRG